jgi:hypothetical protein
MQILIILVLLVSGCTCGGYSEHYNTGANIVKREGFYCSSKDVKGLHIEHQGSKIDLDSSDNQAGEVITNLVDKIPIL